jgi:predicted amidophosphoribosyltransferase
MTACGHVLHPDCLLKWGKDHEGCPSCNQPLRDNEHFLFCRVCEEQEQVVSY